MMKKLTSLLMLALASNVYTQNKVLTDAQLQGLETSLTKQRISVVGWENNQQYVIAPSKGKRELVDVTTGKTSSYTISKPSIEVYEEKNEVYIFDGQQSFPITNSPNLKEENPTLSPDQKWVAFTRKGNLYTINLATKKEVQITHDNSPTIYNGYASWVYMEEILTRSSKYKAFWWSDDSKHIAFMRFDDTEVPEFTLHNSKGHRGTFERTRYPKAGDTNPKVKVGMATPEGGAIVWADFDENTDQYFGLPQWAPDGTLWVRWMPRRQNVMKLFSVNPQDGSKIQTYNEEQSTWIDIDDLEKFTFLKSKKNYIALSDQDGWNHIYLYDMKGKLVKQITSGDWQVTEIHHIDEQKHKIYFTARKESSTTEDFYVVDFLGKQLRRLTSGAYTHEIMLSPDATYFIDNASSIQTPPFTTLYDISGKMIRTISNSKADDFDQYVLPKRAMITIPTSDGWNLPAHILYPFNFDAKKEYPVIFKIYGGPNSGTVRNTWKGISDYWWAKEGIITIEVDHRASGQFGKKGINYDFKNLGKYDLDDYIEAGKWLKKQSWVAKDKLLITGHSYGGYATCMALTKGADVFDFGLAGAPVTSWDLYDSSYTERFMTTPAENPEGYKNGSVLSYISKYKGLLRITHGDIDDNVHIQNTYQLINALQLANKKFELMIYPGSRHGYQNYQRSFDNNQRAQFYYQYLLNKEVPKQFNN